MAKRVGSRSVRTTAPTEAFTAKRSLVRAGFRAAKVHKGVGSSRTLLFVKLGFKASEKESDEATQIVEKATGRETRGARQRTVIVSR